MTAAALEDVPPIDPLVAAPAGVYRDPLVEVRAITGLRPRRVLHTVRTRHFDVSQVGSRIRVDHFVRSERVDDDLSGLLSAELFGPGWLRGPELFERIFTGVVRTLDEDPLAGWELFYRNTLERLGHARGRDHGREPGGAHGTIGGYAPVYEHVEDVLGPGTVLELGCCFGFLSLTLAQRGRAVTASDVSAGTVRLLGAVAPRLGTGLRTVVADAARYPAADRAHDVVLVIHLLEHLDPEHGDRVVAEAARLAGRQVVVGVPLEETADETWGHVRTVSLEDLDRWGRLTGLAYDVHEHHGGWLVINTA